MPQCTLEDPCSWVFLLNKDKKLEGLFQETTPWINGLQNPEGFKPENFMVQMKGRDSCLAQPSLGMEEPAVAGDSTNRAWERDTTHGRD